MATHTDKLHRILRRVEDQTNLKNLIPGSIGYQIPESLSTELMFLEKSFEEFKEKNSLLTSSGYDLDDLALRFFGMKRLPEIRTKVTESMKILKFYVESGTFGNINFDGLAQYNIVIPEGVIISGLSNGRMVKFRTTKETTLFKNEKEHFISAELTIGDYSTIGAYSLVDHNFINYIQGSKGTLKVTNISSISTGRQKETDESFRFRVSTQQQLINSNKESYSLYNNSQSAIYRSLIEFPGVSNILIEPATLGGGTFNIIVQGVTPITSDELVDTLRKYINQTISPWQVFYNIVKPNYIGIATEIEIYSYEPISHSAIQTAVRRIENSINNFYGDVYNTDTIFNSIRSMFPSISDISIKSIKQFYGPEETRQFIELSTERNNQIFLLKNEKLIIEPIQNSILITLA